MAKRNSLKQKLQEGLKSNNAQKLMTKYIDYGRDTRFDDLSQREAYYRGNQYQNRPYDWNGFLSTDLGGTLQMGSQLSGMGPPVSQRRPCAQYELGRIIINRFAALLCGANRFPSFRVPKDQGTEDFMNVLSEQIMLRPMFTQAATLGGSIGSVVVLFKVVDGEFQLECFNTKYVLVEDWADFHAGEMAAFAVTYPYKKQEWDEDKKLFVDKWYIYKRVITDTIDVTCKPIPATYMSDTGSVRQTKEDYIPEIDETESWVHDFGFVPAQFIQNLPSYDTVDGDSTIQCVYNLLDMINEQLSAAHQALLGNLDPTLMISIDPNDYAKLQAAGGIVQKGSGGGNAVVTGEKGNAKYLEITGDGIKLSLELVEKLRQYALEVADCVIADPHRITGAAQSAAAIAKLYASMLAKCDVLRNQYGDGIKRLMAKIVRVFTEKNNITVIDDTGTKSQVRKVFIKPIDSVDPKTDKIVTLQPAKHISYKDVHLVWGDYFEATAADTFQAVEAAVMATGGQPVASVPGVIKYLAQFMGDPDPVRTVAEVEKLVAETRAHEMELAKAGATAKPKPKPGAGKPKPAPTPAGDD